MQALCLLRAILLLLRDKVVAVGRDDEFVTGHMLFLDASTKIFYHMVRRPQCD